ncbi:unnamed protein product, partial [Dibothriocephalus latus]
RRRYPGLLAGVRKNPSSGHASSPTTTTTTTTDTSSVFSAMDRSDQLLLNQRQQALRNLSLADVIHPRQQSAPAAEAVGTTDSSGSTLKIIVYIRQQPTRTDHLACKTTLRCQLKLSSILFPTVCFELPWTLEFDA